MVLVIQMIRLFCMRTSMPGPTKFCYASKDYLHFSIDLLRENRKDILWRISLNNFFFIILLTKKLIVNLTKKQKILFKST